MLKTDRRIFAAHAVHLHRRLLRSSLAHDTMRSLRCSAAPPSWTTWTTNLSPILSSISPSAHA